MLLLTHLIRSIVFFFFLRLLAFFLVCLSATGALPRPEGRHFRYRLTSESSFLFDIL